MKTRIFISSKTNLNYIRHDSSIEVLNDIIEFYPYEKYEDFNELNDYDFYIRLKNDSLAKPDFKTMSYDSLNQRIEKAIKNNIDVIVFVINENEYSLIELIERLIEDRKKLNIVLIKTKLLLYPLDYALLEANKTFKENGDIEFLKEKLKDIEDRFKFYIFTPDKDLIPSISKIEFDEDILNIRRGLLYDCNKDGIMPIKRYKNRYPFDYLVKSMSIEIKNADVIPFILYTNEYSKYIDLLERTIKGIKEKCKIVKEVLPAYYVNLYGINSLIVGFILK